MKALSVNNAKLKTVFPALISLFGSLIAFITLDNHDILKYAISLGILIIGVITIYRNYIRTYNFFYNNESFILQNKIGERRINLIKIKRVKLTLSDIRLMGFQFYEYKIDFTNELKSQETVNFYVSNLNSQLWEFQDLVRQKSSDVIIENHASSWDK